MADKKTSKGIDTLRSDLTELKEAFWALRDGMLAQSAVAAAEHQALAEPHAATKDNVEAEVGAGAIRIAGHMQLADVDGVLQEYVWSTGEAPIAQITSVETEAAAKLLAAIGHRQRLAILLALLSSPRGAVELVNTLSLGTTGAAYHHLNVLQSAGLVTQVARGTFGIDPQRLPSLLSIMAGLGEALDVTIRPVSQPEPEGKIGERKPRKKGKALSA